MKQIADKNMDLSAIFNQNMKKRTKTHMILINSNTANINTLRHNNYSLCLMCLIHFS